MPPRGVIGALAAVAAVALSACAPSVIPAGRPVAAPQVAPDRIVASDEAALPLRRWLPATPARAVIVAAHGFMDYSHAFALPGDAWAKRGIATWAWDQRGFGAAPHRGRWAGTATYVDDLAAIVALARAAHPGVPVFVLGESMGGAIAIVAAAEGRLDGCAGIILVAPAVVGRDAAGPVASAIFSALAHTVPWLAGPTGTFIRPTDNPELLRQLANDPLILRNPRLDMTWGLFELMGDAADSGGALRLPTLLLLGARDPLVLKGPMRALIDSLPPAGPDRRRVAVYTEGWHMLLRDLDAARVHEDVASWILSRQTDPALPLPSGADRAFAGG